MSPETTRCTCMRCRICDMTWPAMLIALGVLFFIGQYSRYSFGDLWPVLLIVWGLMSVAASLASTEGHAAS
jgi:hypothetical protein